jgi:cytochrome c oxidase subunit 2
VLPAKTHIRVLVTGADVMHAFAVPSLAVKADACPGQLNALSFIMKRTGLFFGVCAELCGPAHYKMPIVIESVNVEDYCN